MLFSITSRPQFHFSLTRSQLGVLLKCSEHHYDGRCKESGKIGGFLYGWNNCFQFNSGAGAEVNAAGERVETVHATWEQIDLCLKILECANMLFRYQLSPHDNSVIPEMRRAVEMTVAFNRALHRANKLYEQWQEEFDSNGV